MVAIFANYLIIDVVLCATPRVLTMFFFPEIRGSICSPDSINVRLQALQSSGLLTSAESQGVVELELTEQCMSVILVLQVFAALVAVGLTFVQVLLAMKVRTYSRILQERQDVEEAGASPLKEHYEDSPTFSAPLFTDEKQTQEA
ncbi:MAG: hypothetical protein Q9162_000029 [Coniocarpon cinnabarinum]